MIYVTVRHIELRQEVMRLSSTNLYIIIFILLFCIILPAARRRRTMAALRITKRKRKKLTLEERIKMYEIIKRFIGKECIISLMTGETSQVKGTIKDVQENWVVIDTGYGDDVINIDYITRVREYPRNKNGKKKAFVD